MTLRLDSVTRVYRKAAEDVIAVDSVSFSIERGTALGLVGPSGSGKTTLINLIVGWDVPDSGSVAWDEKPGEGWDAIAVVPQGLGLLDELTLRENIVLPVVLGNREHRDAGALIDQLGLGEVADELPGSVSLGEQQRAAVARALITGPDLLVADEPTSHQDEANAERIAALLAEAATDGAVLVATHDERILDHVGVVLEMRDGRLTTSA